LVECGSYASLPLKPILAISFPNLQFLSLPANVL
jgi:hypothetical protein